jgi:glyoxylase-like metal-dependent hydrolase (beta-lactamase superfamily II)
VTAEATDSKRWGGWTPKGVTLVRAPNAGPLSLTGTNTWLIGNPAWIVDPGPADPGHMERVQIVGKDLGGVEGIVLTHRHVDHAETAAFFSERFGVPVFAGHAPAERAPYEPAVEGLTIERELADGERLGPFVVYETPGHSADHLSFLAGDVLFCGDTVLGEGSVIIPPGGGSLGRYLESLRRLRELELDAICPGHGPVVWDAHAKLDEYIEHRLDRERRLLVALERGLRRREELLDEVWNDVPAVLRPAAALTLEAHLDKLEQEGRLPEGVERQAP